MTFRDKVKYEYFEWLYDLVCKRYSEVTSFRELLRHLHDTEFIFTIPRDVNRAEDGINLRYRFSCDKAGFEEMYLKGPCSVLEMMVALAIRCEIDIMDEPQIGDRTSQWFWGMIVNLGLGSMSDDRYDEAYVTDVLERFLHRDYEADGRGGLFRIRNTDRDLRSVEIWYQLCWYLDSIT